ncbi:MAG: DUF1851 domain-containing protein [bacterium]|nr:DUF1851 domain-containing protein [bacterium]
MSEPTFIINPGPEKIEAALESWQWLPISGKEVAVITSFGDLFLQDAKGIWFLDTLDGSLNLVCRSIEDLEALLNTEAGQDQYLLAGLVLAATDQEMLLEPGQCYDFEINPVLGGAMEIENVEVQDFVVAVNIAGQIHEQVKDLPPGAPVSEIKIAEPGA